MNIARYQVDPSTRLLSGADAQQVRDSLKSGGVALLPSDTGYMLSADVDSAIGIGRINEIKGRDAASTLHLACASAEVAESLGVFDVQARRVLYEMLPGPVSIVVMATDRVRDYRMLKDGTVGIRVPAAAATLQVLELLGGPVTATSVNRSGAPPIDEPTDSAIAFILEHTDMVSVVEDSQAVLYPVPSTMVRMIDGSTELLREGPVALADIKRVAEHLGYIDVAEWT